MRLIRLGDNISVAMAHIVAIEQCSTGCKVYTTNGMVLTPFSEDEITYQFYNNGMMPTPNNTHADYQINLSK